MATTAVDLPDVQATAEAPEQAHEVLDAPAMQDVASTPIAEEVPVAEEVLVTEQVPVAEEVSTAEREPAVEEMPVVEEVPDAAQMPVAEDWAVAEDERVTEEIPIFEMNMPATESDTVVPSTPTVEVEDASAALAQAIEIDPDSITSKPAQVESIRIIEAHDVAIEMREQGTAEGEAEPIGRPWEPVDTGANRSPVSFDIPESDANDPGVAEESVDKDRKPDRRLKLNKLQKHARSAPEPEPEPAQVEPAPAPAPKLPREPRLAAFAKLTEYQNLSLAHVPGLPEETDVPGHWRGVGFGLGGRRLVTAFDEVVEIMRMPQITHVPGTQPWMLGVANVRGTLLPVVDLKQFLEGERTVMHEGQRVLVVRQTGGNVAVLIDQLYGQRSFNDSQKTTTAADKASRYGYFIKQVYRVGDNDWGVFSMSMLTRTPEFRQAAA